MGEAMHGDNHLDDEGRCDCVCSRCTDDPQGEGCICPDCNQEACGMHDG